MLQYQIFALLLAVHAVIGQNCQSQPIGTLLPNPEDCNAFYQCTSSGPLLMSCHPDLHFSPKTGHCEYPETAECESTGELCQGQPIGTLLPDPNDCGSFYQCTLSGAIKLACAGGLHFNPRTKRCEYSELAGCEKVDDDEAAQIPCPGEDDPETLIFFPSEKNCAWYYLCYGGKAQRFECAPGLYWNQEAVRCDLSENVNCRIIQSTTNSPTLPPPSSGVCEGKNQGEFVPHPYNCQLFYQCREPVPVLLQCPDILLFSSTTLTCDFPIKAGCMVNRY